MYEDELLNVVSNWSVEQLDGYIQKLEARITGTRILVTQLKNLRKKKKARKNLENGPRDGR